MSYSTAADVLSANGDTCRAESTGHVRSTLSFFVPPVRAGQLLLDFLALWRYTRLRSQAARAWRLHIARLACTRSAGASGAAQS